MYILEGFRLKCVFASMIAFSHFSLNVVPWYTTVSKKIVSVSDILAVNFIVGWCVSLLVPWIWRNLRCLVYFCPKGKKCHLCRVFKQLVWRRFCLNFVFQCMRQWKFGKEAMCSHRGIVGFYWLCFPLNWKEFSLRINLSISRTKTRNVQFFHLCLFNKIYKVGSIFKVWLL